MHIVYHSLFPKENIVRWEVKLMLNMFAFLQQKIGNVTGWRKLYCVLRGGKLLCYCTPEEIEAKVEPTLTVSVNKVKYNICYSS